MLHCVILCVIPIINFRNGHSTCTTVTIHDLSNGFLVLPLGGEVCVAGRERDHVSSALGELVRRRFFRFNLSLDSFVCLTWICGGFSHCAFRGILLDPPTALVHYNLQWIIPPWEEGWCNHMHTYRLFNSVHIWSKLQLYIKTVSSFLHRCLITPPVLFPTQ